MEGRSFSFRKKRFPLELLYPELRFIFLTILLVLACRGRKLIERVDTLIEKGELKEAQRILIESDTTRDVYHVLMGDVLQRKNKLLQALNQYSRVSGRVSGSLKDRLIRGLLLLGRRSQRKGEIYIAQRAYQKIMEIDSSYPLGDGFLLLGNLAFREEKYDSAYLYYRKYLSMGGNKRYVLEPYAISLYELGLYDSVIALLPKGPTLPSADLVAVFSRSLYHKALLLYEKGELDSAIFLIRKIPKDPGPGVLLKDSVSLLMGKIYEEMGDTARAIRYYTDILMSKRYTALRDSAKELIRTLRRQAVP